VKKLAKKNPEDCAHARINRVMDEWRCNECGAKFQPVNPKHRTKWDVEERTVAFSVGFLDKQRGR